MGQSGQQSMWHLSTKAVSKGPEGKAAPGREGTLQIVSCRTSFLNSHPQVFMQY